MNTIQTISLSIDYWTDFSSLFQNTPKYFVPRDCRDFVRKSYSNLILDSYVGLLTFFIITQLIGAPCQSHP